MRTIRTPPSAAGGSDVVTDPLEPERSPEQAGCIWSPGARSTASSDDPARGGRSDPRWTTGP
ncbi:hypothetical protein CRV15_28620 (plasmid) [Streptomyces clavuligerus]|nr:hypothetical protein CRV15_28620 [Streptomyces clavuligerus]